MTGGKFILLPWPIKAAGYRDVTGTVPIIVDQIGVLGETGKKIRLERLTRRGKDGP